MKFPKWSEERMREMAEAEPGGLMVCSPEFLADLKVLAGDDPAIAATLRAAGIKLEHVEKVVAPWAGSGRDIDPFNNEDVKAFQERDRQAIGMLSEARPISASPSDWSGAKAVPISTDTKDWKGSKAIPLARPENPKGN